jgi:hypothetical protein
VAILPAKIRNAEIQMSKFKALSCFGHSYSVLLNAITPAIFGLKVRAMRLSERTVKNSFVAQTYLAPGNTLGDLVNNDPSVSLGKPAFRLSLVLFSR